MSGKAARNFPFRPYQAFGTAVSSVAREATNRTRIVARAQPRPQARTLSKGVAEFNRPSDRLCRRRALRPQSFQIVELTDLRSENMNDHIAGIDQHPIAIGQTLDMGVWDSALLETFGDVLRDRTDMPVNPAGGDDHVIGKGRFAAKVYGDRVFRLHIVQAGEDHIQGLVGV